MDDVEISGNVVNDKNGKINMGNAILQNGTIGIKGKCSDKWKYTFN